MQFTALNFTCPSCGAPQRFSPVTGTLTCEFCDTQTPIESSLSLIKEYDFNHAIAGLNTQENKSIEKEVLCKKCGASFHLTPYSFSSNCPFCNTPALIDFIQEITPQSLLPFQMSQKEALHAFKTWVGSRWFAPTAFQKYLEGDQKLIGYYLPYWTYDSNTTTPYQGLRGDTYYVTVTKTVIENGRQRQIHIQEARIRWTNVSGSVQVNFDDVTVGASKTISRAILEALEPWDTTPLVPFDTKYLAGFEAQEYTIGLDNGFEYAKAKMSSKIKHTIMHDIGGDQQQITSMQTHHNNVTYKNTLFPIWTASFTWKNKTYNYAINAQSGKIVGERPYSYVKIGFAIITTLLVLGIAGYFYKAYESKNLSQGSYSIQVYP